MSEEIENEDEVIFTTQAIEDRRMDLRHENLKLSIDLLNKLDFFSGYNRKIRRWDIQEDVNRNYADVLHYIEIIGKAADIFNEYVEERD